jgi:hypothetical protein
MAKMKKEKSPFRYVVYAAIIAFGAAIGILVGVSMDNSAVDGEVQFKKMEMPPITVETFKEALKEDSRPQNGAMYGALGAFIILMMNINTKRFHRKGEEHGSAEWATRDEKSRLRSRGFLISKKRKLTWRSDTLLPVPRIKEVEKRQLQRRIKLTDFVPPGSEA